MGIDDAPEEFTSAQIRAIVGIELSIESVEGKAKMSQNQPERNRTGVIEGLRRSGTRPSSRSQSGWRPRTTHANRGGQCPTCSADSFDRQYRQTTEDGKHHRRDIEDAEIALCAVHSE